MDRLCPVWGRDATSTGLLWLASCGWEGPGQPGPGKQGKVHNLSCKPCMPALRSLCRLAWQVPAAARQ